MNFPCQKVMIIDDTYIDRYIAEKILNKYSYAEQVLSLDSAIEALDYFGKQAAPDDLPQLIFLDISMPRMDGFQFLEAFNDLPAFIREYCKVIMLTSSLNKEDSESALKHPNVIGFINKPLDEEKLKKVLVQ